uniref:Uncharacterized protein n=1 Tax=Solibacter usitatus (strain Ellin6076) TaxID=234267 RepID=Q020R9_SOLUE
MDVKCLVLGLGVMAMAGFAPRDGKVKFGEINVERINIVERDGQIKMVISNRERFPDPGNVVTGKFQKRAGLRSPGITFYNEKGDECGGLIYTSKEEADGKYVAGSLLALDKYNGDQVMGMQYEESGSKRVVGLHVWDQPDAEQKKASQRVFIGRSMDRSARLLLSDANGKVRIRMVVEQGGQAKLEFLDENGKVLQTLPDARGGQ